MLISAAPASLTGVIAGTVTPLTIVIVVIVIVIVVIVVFLAIRTKRIKDEYKVREDKGLEKVEREGEKRERERERERESGREMIIVTISKDSIFMYT